MNVQHGKVRATNHAWVDLNNWRSGLVAVQSGYFVCRRIAFAFVVHYRVIVSIDSTVPAFASNIRLQTNRMIRNVYRSATVTIYMSIPVWPIYYGR